MSEESLRAEINRLNGLAIDAYKRRDFKEEDRLDSLAKPLRQRLLELTGAKCLKCGEWLIKSEIDDAGLCYSDSDKSVHTSHSYDPAITDQNQRCGRCGVKRYHHRAHWKCGADLVE